MAAIGEYVFLFGMGMEIDEHLYSIVMLEDVLLYVHDLFWSLLFWGFPASVEIVACEVAAGVAEDDSIRVDHGYYLYYVLLEEFIDDMQFWLLITVLYEEVIYLLEDALDYMWACGLYWMSSAHDIYNLLLLQGEMEGLGWLPRRKGEDLYTII